MAISQMEFSREMEKNSSFSECPSEVVYKFVLIRAIFKFYFVIFSSFPPFAIPYDPCYFLRLTGRNIHFLSRDPLWPMNTRRGFASFGNYGIFITGITECWSGETTKTMPWALVENVG
jgi:hypothetical protein